MKAVIIVDVPDYQMGQEVSVYFKDTMCIKSICQEDSTIKELEKIRAEIMSIGNWREHYEMPNAYLSCLTIVEHHISELKKDKCDNDHDCEHCDWVECPEMEG